VESIPLVDLRAQHASLGGVVEAAIERVIHEQRFILGEEVSRLEEGLAARCGVPAAVGVASGSDALYLALVAAGVGPSDEVITTSFSYFATAGAIARTGAVPRFVDLEADGYNLDPEGILRAASPRTRAVLPVHLFGRMARIEPVVALARARGWAVIEDVAQAIAASRGGKQAGSFGEHGCLSFHPSKNLGAWGDGGMVLCASEESAAALRRLRVHGGVDGVHDRIGINSRLDALQAAVLHAKLPSLEGWSEARRARAASYRARLTAARLDEVVRAQAPDTEGVEVVHHFVVRCRERDGLLHHLAARGIGAAVYYPRPLHLQPCFAHLGGKPGDYPNAEQAAREVLSLPLYPELTEAQQDRVVDAMAEFYRSTAR